MVLGPGGTPDASLPIAASRAGAAGILNLEFSSDSDVARDILNRLTALARGRCGILLDATGPLLPALLDEGLAGVDVVVLAGCRSDLLASHVARIQTAGIEVYAVASSTDEAAAAEAAGVDAVVAKGLEAGGWVGEEGSFVLLQRLRAQLSVPVWVQGGIGVHTAAACSAAGAAGAVLDGQLLLTRESPLDDAVRSRLQTFDGSETICLGAELGGAIRIYSQPGLAPVAELVELERSLLADGADEKARGRWRAAVRAQIDWQAPERRVLAIGQDASFAAGLAHRFVTVGGILSGLREATDEHVRSARRCNALSAGSPLALSHRTRYPLVQGPMTRVSDTAEFASAVADAGALPFLALALMRGADAAALLDRTRRILGERPWGVGILGFVPPELRAEQMQAVRDHMPPFALIAGGRPDQARALEDDGIATYLHVPSPGLLELYMNDGARRFVFEGRECGGHVGPRTSFVLWETMLRTLLEKIPPGADPSEYHILLAGGIHDGTSAAMAATAAATLAERGVRVGALMGTAYLFTEEAVSCGAITPGFQEAATACRQTVLLQTGPGHTTRCLPSPFVEYFREEKRRLLRAGTPAEEVRNHLEALNIGRLRLAAKGVERDPRFESDPAAPKLTRREPPEQWARGMYMIGQAAALADRVCSIGELHETLERECAQRLQALPEPEPSRETAPAPADVAIIGIGCIFPGAADLQEFWANILAKHDAIGEVPPERWDWRPYFDSDRAAPDKIYSRWGGFIADVPFDPVTFGMPPNSLPSIEPSQLLGLLVARAALEDAGYSERPFARERTSVIFGAGGGGGDVAVGYTVRSSLPMLFGDCAAELTDALEDALPSWTEDSFAGILMNVIAGRIANRLDLGGFNYTVDSACASSLTAVCLAVAHLQAGTTEMAIAGGVDTIQNPFAYLCFSKTQALSPTGRCRPFDAAADGIAISEGFAAVVLKRLADAERDGDRVYAVIRGTGGASDGRDRSLTAARPEGQLRALRRAYAQARYSLATVELIEAHGTGTVAGDRAEVEALRTAFDQEGAALQGCAIGSVKSMIGHTKATAGVAGLIKAAMALHHRVLPPTLASQPNPKVGFAQSPFYVNTEARPWLRAGDAGPRRAGVSAFGFGGTDFHLALEEYVADPVAEAPPTLERWPAELFVWRGDSRAELQASVSALVEQLDADPGLRLLDVAHTVARAAAREPAGANLALVARSLPDLAEKLRAARHLLDGDGEREHAANGIHYSQRPLACDGSVAFLFPGQGSQCVDMARELAVVFPEVRACFERADAVIAERLTQPLSRYVFPPPALSAEDERRQQAELRQTAIAQPALGATELALLRLLSALGVTPQMTAGHSYGELVALAAAGSLSDEDLLRLSEARGRFISTGQAGEPGAMAAIVAAPAALEPLLSDPDLVLANLNGPRQTVISGASESVERAIRWCRDRELRVHRLAVACAFHSPAMAPAKRLLADWLAQVPIVPPRIPVYSNTTAGPYPQEPAAIAGLLSEQLVSRVEFAREIEAMHDAGARLFVEVGPRSVLAGLVAGILEGRPHVCVPTDRPGQPALVQLLDCLAALAAEGVPVNTDRLLRGRPAAPRPALSPTTWKVNGGRARPNGARAPQAAPRPVSVALAGAAERGAAGNGHAAADHDGNGAGHRFDRLAYDGGAASPRTNGGPTDEHPDDDRPQAVTIADMTPAGDRATDVMRRHQEVMQHFLETERAVMLAYLSAPDAITALRQAPSGDRPERQPTLDLPAPAAVAPDEPQPAVVAPEPPPAQLSGNGGPSPSLTSEELTEMLLRVVSERTGFPPDMLTLDADLEADLSLDSIKRVEIAGTMLQTLPLPSDAAPDVEQITASRTLRQVVAALEAMLLTTAGGADAGDAHAATGADPLPFEVAPADEHISRLTLQAVAAPPVAADARLAEDGVVMIVDDESGVGAELATELRRRGHHAVRIVSRQPPGEAPGVVALGDVEQLPALLDAVLERHGRVKALVHLAALAGGDDPGDWRMAVDRDLALLFALARALQPQLHAAAADGGAAVVGATALGGAFATRAPAPECCPAHAAIPGFLKSLAHEWPAVRVKAVDLEVADSPVTAQRLLAELLAADEVVEVGYREGERVALELVDAGHVERPVAEPLDDGCVVLVTGGARGITAEAAVMLARRYRPTLVLVGRTELVDEDAQIAELVEPAAIKRALLERRRRQGADESLPAVERDYRRLRSLREVRDNLRRLRDTGARVEYVACDVRDGEAFGALIEDVYATHGRIDAVIHGAGIIEDKLIADKELPSVERVVATKLAGAYTLAERLRPEGLRFLVFFGSVAGRYGNRGQADYAAASEVLNKLAQQLDARWPARVVTLNWGPWLKTGMVSPELRRQFTERGVHLLTPELGCRVLDDELRLGRKGEAEVVVVVRAPQDDDDLVVVEAARSESDPLRHARAMPLVPDDRALERRRGGVELLRPLDPEHDVYLSDHRIDGKPVLPFAAAIELMAELAAAGWPELDVAEIRDVRLLHGVVIDEDAPPRLRIGATPIVAADEQPGKLSLQVTIADCDDPAREHYRAVVDLRRAGSIAAGGNGVPAAPVPFDDLSPFAMPVADAYERYLFHGPLLQGIVAIEGMDLRGASAILRPSVPAACLGGSPAGEWLLDPVLVDCALQLQVVWARIHWDLMPLPTTVASLRLVGDALRGASRSSGGSGLVRVELRMRAENRSPLCRADHFFYDPRGRLLATLTDVVGPGSRALNRLRRAT